MSDHVDGDAPALARDAAGVTRLTDAEAMALARYVALGWFKGESPPSFASDTDSDKDAEMLARYVLAVAPVVAAARAQANAPHDWGEWVVATAATEAAVRARDAAAVATEGGSTDVLLLAPSRTGRDVPWRRGGCRSGAMGIRESGRGMSADTLAPARAPLPEPSRPPCPFCGSKAFTYPQYRDRMWHIWCRECGANGPTADSAEQALAAWARAQQQPALPAEVRGAMHEAIDALDDAGKRLRHRLNTDEQVRAGDACYAASARLRELAGEP